MKINKSYFLRSSLKVDNTKSLKKRSVPLLITFLVAYTVMLSIIPSKTVAQENTSMVLYQKEDMKIKWHLQFGVNAVAETNLFWNLADVEGFDFDSDTEWLESYLKPGISIQKSVGKDAMLYGKVSSVGSYTWDRCIRCKEYRQGNS